MHEKFKYYKLDNNYLFSLYEYDDLDEVLEEEISPKDFIYFLNPMNPINSRKSFSISSPSLLFLKEEGLNILQLDSKDYPPYIPSWIIDKINDRKVTSINTSYPNWQDLLHKPIKKKWKLNLVALGDVGSTLLIGLRLLGGECIDTIGIYDRNINRLKRWEYELNQIRRPFDELAFPKVISLEEDDLFDCDMFIFCASKGIPPVGSDIADVRMAQFKSNSEIISEYSKLARERNFQGIFAVVSDPVDLLCKVAFLESNKDNEGNMDFKGLSSDQIIGYGLGVMNGRACFYAEQSGEMVHYIEEGRVFGPHGEGLIVADSIKNYNAEISNYLTDKTVNANKEVRGFGYKPFVAPSLSSGALSIIATINSDWFYGSTYMREVYMGSKCRLLPSGIEVEQLDLPNELFSKIQETYNKLAMII
ncbi:lactate dehydrogenase [Tissierella sp. MB52-C2]|uniref:lactate dehydrogenase n=1 Tax=Tissierella sp. MB52-C2 TaxID=3070999 RepID=UPI00280A89AB|nr:lactate dehydrogenase [Tissierella sp. MB52-C2]WMM25931.1 lactate dehydrogenase [Tissierella sp. MB52-C2]